VRNPLLYILFLCSGAAGLIYELVWVRELIFVFGGTTYAITTVLVAFMAGLGFGSYFAGRWCYRLTRPGRVYGTLEIGIGLYALIVPFLLKLAVPLYHALYTPLADWPWVLNLVRFCLGGLMLLVPTMCMGATLPVLVRYVSLQGRALGQSVGQLYGINTFGAVLGTVGAGFWLIPTLGLLHTTWTAAAINIAIGIAAINLLHRPVTDGALGARRESRSSGAKPAAGKTPRPAARQQESPWLRRTVLIGFAVSGFAAMVYQITWTRALIMSVGSTTYAFTCILAAFILGLALGSLAIARWVDRWKSPAIAFGVLELLIGLVAVVIVPIHGRIPLVVETLVNRHYMNYDALLTWQFLLIIAVTFVPTFLMGAIFPLVIRALAAKGDEPGAATGRAYLVNTLGTIAGSFLAGFVLIRSDMLGVQNSIILASVLNGLVGVALLTLARPAAGRAFVRRAAVPGIAVLLILGVGLGAGRWDPHILTAAPFMMRGSSAAPRDIVYYGEGVDVTVSVEHPKDAPQVLTLRVNGKPDASTVVSDMVTMLLLGHLPALLHPEARSACMVGLGSGISLAALGCHPSFERLDCVEISDDVIKAAACFAPYTYNVLTRDPRVHMILADGRNHLQLTDQVYDLIITQPSNPWMAGISNLFTREYFELGRSRLSEHGLMAVWLQGYKSSVQDFQMIVRTLFDVFGHVSLWELAEQDYLMIASRQPQHVRYEDFARRFRVPTVRADLYRVSIRWPADVLGRYVTSDEPLREWVRDAPVHTDDNALLEFSAPRHMYESQGKIAQALLPLQRPVLDDLLTDPVLPPGLAAQVDTVVAARLAPTRAQALLPGGVGPLANHVAALQTLIDAYVHCPYDAQLFQFVTISRKNYQAQPELANNPQIAPLLARLGQVRPPPPGAPVNGASLLEIATALCNAAQGAIQRSQWRDAASLLYEAHDLDPDNQETTRQLADALARVGRAPEAATLLDEVLQRRPDDGGASRARAILAVQANDHATALRVLEAALKWGSLTREKLATDEAFGALRGDGRFQALLQTAPAELPASQPK
jgi:spermidine synthase